MTARSACRSVVTYLLALFSFFNSAVSFSADRDEVSREELFPLITDQDVTHRDFSLPRSFSFPTHARDSSYFGIDVSHYTQQACQCDPDWDKIFSQKVSFVYLKATQGIRYIDPSFAKFRTNLSARNKDRITPFGAYHFLTATDDAGEQMRHFLNVLDKTEAMLLPPSLDLEWHPGPMTSDCPNNAIIVTARKTGSPARYCDRWAALSSDEIITRTNIAIDKIKHHTGRDPLIYTNSAWWRARVGSESRIDELHSSRLWIADYSKSGLATETPRVPNGKYWAIWQFTNIAEIHADGVVLKIDASVIHGPLETLYK